MIILGLTGGMGAGKGYVSAIFAEHGIQSIDTDKVSRQVCEPGSACLEELRAAFGEGILLPDGTLDRRALASLAFADEASTALLNAVTHKHILAVCKSWLAEREASGDFAAILDAPLLYESKFNCICDFVIAVLANLPLRVSRAVRRDNTTEEAVMARIARQHTNEFFRSRADYIIYNNVGSNVRAQVDLIMQQLRFRG